MKKILFGILCLIMLFITSSCDQIIVEQQDQEDIYLLAVEAGYSGTYEEWLETVKGDKGDPGVSVLSIDKTSSDGLVDTYTIKYSDGKTSTFIVTNGKDGINGIKGEPGADGHTPVITIENGNWYIDGVDTGKQAQGLKGETGNGISSIDKTSSEGLVDTYTITFTNGTTTTFTITNGNNGDDGLSAYEIYCKYHDYSKTEEEWINDLVNGRLTTQKECIVNFDTCGGPIIEPVKVKYGQKVNKPIDPVMDGYIFIGWYVEDEKWSFIGYSVTEDITLTAKWEQVEVVNLKYDDRYDISGKNIEMIESNTPTSFKVGYGVLEHVKDDVVISIINNQIVAVGIGSAKVKIDGKIYIFNVEPAVLSVFFLFGQSNMEGISGKAAESIANINGQVYSTYGSAGNLKKETGALFVPSALTGEYSLINTMGTTNYLENHPVNSLTADGNGKIGADSAIAYRFNQLTGDKVWVINSAHGGTAIKAWQEGGTEFIEAMSMFEGVKKTLESEIKAGHYILGNYGYFWCQGCADTSRTAEDYAKDYINMHNALKKNMYIDHDGNNQTDEITLEFAAIIPIRAGRHYQSMYREGIYLSSVSNEYSSYTDLQMSGPRVAQFWLGNNPSFPDIHLVFGTGEEWVTKVDGTDDVEEYFNRYYNNGIINYPTQSKTSDAWKKPTSPNQLHPDIHYTQIGYNEVGLRSAENLAYILKRVDAPNEELSVRFLSWDGFTEVNEIESSIYGNSMTLVVPVVYPLWKAKEVTYSISEGFSFDYYDVLTNISGKSGKLYANEINKEITIKELEKETLSSYRFEIIDDELTSISSEEFKKNQITQENGTITNGLIQNGLFKIENAIVLLNNEEWSIEIKAKGNWTGMIFGSSKNTYEAQLPYIFKTTTNSGLIAFGSLSSNGVNNYGLSINSLNLNYNNYHVYRFENHLNEDGTNMVYLSIDGVVIGAMNNYYIGGNNNQNKQVDWISGKNFFFTYMGSSSHLLNNINVEYIQINETK